MPELFLRLVTVTDQGDLTVRQAARAELPADIEPVLDRFAYLVSGGDPVRLLRPALPLAWPRLRAWIQADRDGLAVHRRIASAAGSWASGGRREADLFQGSVLDDAQRWAAAGRRNITLTPAERDFLEAGAALARRRGRRVRAISVALAVLLVLALAAGGLALRQSRELAAQRDVAESGRLAALADSVRGKDPVLGMLLGVAAHRIADTPQARAAMDHGLTSAATRSFRDPATTAGRALSPDGRRLFSESDGQVRVWDTRTGRRTAAFRHQSGTFLSMAVSPSGRTIAIATEEGGVRLWNAATGAALKPRLKLFDGAGDSDFGLSYSRSEDVVVMSMGQGLTFWNTRTGTRGTAPTLGGLRAVTPDGKAAVYTFMDKVLRQPLPRGKAVTLWRTCRSCYDMALSPDGATVVAGREGDQDMVVYDTRTGKQEDSVYFMGWAGGTLSWSRDGRFVAALGASRLQVWRADDRETVFEQPVPPGAAELAFDPDLRTLRYLVGDTVVSVDFGAKPPAGPRGDLLSPGGRHLLSGSKVRDLVTGRSTAMPVEGSSETVFNRGGSALAMIRDSSVVVHDVATGRRLSEVPLGEESGRFLAFSPDGTRLAVATEKHVLVVDPTTGRRLWGRAVETVERVVFTPDGRRLGADTRFFDAATGSPTPFQPLGANVRDLTVSGAGDFYGWPDGSARLAYWRQGTAEPSSAPLRDLPLSRPELMFSADGVFVAAGDTDGVTVYDLASGVAVATMADAEAGQVRFSGDRLLAIVDGRLVEHPLDPAAVAAKVCARAGRSLSAEEWAAYVPGLPYREVCSK
ncbi:WD40 repeat domain-containing protein [Nonomuraea sp. bgisy101]|uniref:WD40 repeat domain-containing protein n=1 Tax=Nonomuraea sp. bgisy101 TaxID=3413784 RepID=UPI003D711CF0